MLRETVQSVMKSGPMRINEVWSGELDLLMPCPVVNVTAETDRAATPMISQHQTTLLASEPSDARQKQVLVQWILGRDR